MAQILSKVLDAILANVELTIVTGIIPTDLKLIFLSCRLPKMKKIEPWEF
jgi:hypothetical protein